MSMIDRSNPTQHPLKLLPDFAAGRLDPASEAEVQRHVDECSDCRIELSAWRNVAGATAAAYSPAATTVPDGLRQRVVDAVSVASDEDLSRRSMRRRLVWLGRFVAAQVPLVRREIWPASIVVMAIGAAVSLVVQRGGAAPGSALALLAPLAAALGIAMIYGEENDPALELALAAPTSPRLVVVARLVVVLAWDLALALGASAVLALADRPSIFLPVVAQWLGPMLLLGCLTLLLSLFIDSSLAIAAACLIWFARALELSGQAGIREIGGLATLMDAAWQTSLVTVATSVVVLGLALVLIPYREPFNLRRGA